MTTFNQRIYNPILNSDIWDEDDSLRKDIKDSLLKIAQDFYESTNFKAKIKDIVFLGSSANYNWTPTSDIDIHIVVDYDDLGVESEEALEKILAAFKSKWKYEHDIKIVGHDVELYIQDSDAGYRSSGVYSLIQDDWVSKPVKEKVEIDKMYIAKIYKTLVDLYKKCKSDGDALGKWMDKVYEIRQSGLDREGELSNENIVFKLLRAKGYIESASDTKNDEYDKSVSIDK